MMSLFGEKNEGKEKRVSLSLPGLFLLALSFCFCY